MGRRPRAATSWIVIGSKRTPRSATPAFTAFSQETDRQRQVWRTRVGGADPERGQAARAELISHGPPACRVAVAASRNRSVTR